MGPTDVTGFDGHTTIASAPEIASSTAGVGAATAAPAYSTSSTVGRAFSRTKYSWKSSQPSGVRRRVRTGASVIGRTVEATPSARAMVAVTAERLAPAR